MAFGILEDHKLEQVPGTGKAIHFLMKALSKEIAAFLHEQTDVPREYQDVPADLLKHATGRLSHIILVPQPSDSPNDPLNVGEVECIVITELTTSVATMEKGHDFAYCRALSCCCGSVWADALTWICDIGLSLFIANPLAKVWGKRPVYIVAIIIMLVCSIWGAFSKNYSSFLASRIVSGFGMAPYEVLVQCTIADLYFTHQRATRIAVWNLFLLSGISGGALISGYIIEDLGWKWTFGICAIMFGIFVVLVILFVPETTYARAPVQIRYAGMSLHPESEKPKLEIEHQELPRTPQPVEEKHSYIRSLRVYTGRHTQTPFWKILIRPVVVFWYPAVLWAFLLYGVTLTWIVVFSVVNAAIFTLPPYNFSVSETGLISLSPFIMTIVGEVIAGPLNDYLCVVFARRNHGIYEPEFRLLLMIPVLLIGTAGFFGFGATVHFQTHWSGPVLCFGLANMALAFANGCVFGYVIDSHESLAEEALVAINARNFLTFGLTYFVNDWLAKDGALNVFNVLGGTFIAVCGLTVPLWIFGKRIRSSIARNAWLNDFMRG